MHDKHRNYRREDSSRGHHRNEQSRGSHPEPIFSKTVEIEEGSGFDRKKFFVDLHKNHRGPFVKLTEKVGERRNTVLIPREMLADVISALQDAQDQAEEIVERES